MQNQPFKDWDELKAKVEERSGLTKSQLLDAFFAMHHGENRTSAAFTEWVNDKRLLYKVPAV